MASMPTIAEVVTAYVMTDGTIHICGFSDVSANDFSHESPVYCETPEDALDYLRDADVLSVNPAWYGRGEANG